MDELLDFNQLKKRKVVVTALFCLLSFLLMVIIHENWKRIDSDRERLTQKATDAIRMKEEKVRSLLLEFDGRKSGFEKQADFFSWADSTGAASEGISLLVYRRDTLIYWSDHRFAPILREQAFPDGNSFALLGNGWYRIMETRSDSMSMEGLILVKNEFPYQNDYLVNNFQKGFGLPEHVGISDIPGDYPVYSSDGTHLFSLVFNTSVSLDHGRVLILTALFMVGIILLVLLMYYAYKAFTYLEHRKILFLAAFLGDLIILRLLILWLKVPDFLFSTSLFGPEYFATSWWNGSLGDLVIHCLMALFFAYAFYQNFKGIRLPMQDSGKIALVLIFLVVSLVLIFGLAAAIRTMVIDSSIVLNLNNIFNIDGYSILGFIALTSLVLAYFLLSAILCRHAFSLAGSSRRYIFFTVIAMGLVAVYLLLNSSGPDLWITWAGGSIYLLAFSYFLPREEQYRTLPGAVFFIILFALMTTFLLDGYHIDKEREYRKLLASELATRRDPMLEYEFSSVRKKILDDPAITDILSDTSGDRRAMAYLEERYFSGFWNKYEILITPCHPGEMLNVQPEDFLVRCDEYFTGLVNSFGQASQDSGLWFIDRRTENSNYLAIFKLKGDEGRLLTVYIEFFSKLIPETGLGYPDLLIDKNARLTTNLQDYSYARYFRDKLEYKYGTYSYRLAFQLSESDSATHFTEVGGYDHYIERSEPDNILVISRKNPSILDLVAPFSYLFLFYGIFLLVFVLAVMLPEGFRDIELNFRNRLQAAILFLILLSFIVIGFLTRSSIVRLNNNKNRDNLSEKAFSVLVEMEHKLGSEPSLTPDMESYIGGLLNKFSLVFFSDINLYDTAGSLIASSRPQIFEEMLVSRKMHPEAYRQLVLGERLLFIQREMIGRQDYLSAYLPFRNNHDQIIGYLNLPYFAKQNELQAEIADFIAAFINTYVLLIVIAILLTIFVSRYITQPLKLIREKMGKVVYGKPNDKIEWNKEDEIGSLVAEYNRMLDELSRSAELLARSERESAWREMAMQVAHEIKNPLTPMKLSVQHLKRAWESTPEDFGNRLARFTGTIVEQIESLAEIATAFSDFARMPSGNPELIELGGIATHAIELFRDQSNISFNTDFQPAQCPLIADPSQMLRVFNNLIRNAVEAIGRKEDGQVSIRIRLAGSFYEVEVSDNGSGMTEAQQAKVFSPSFTTKTGGMGLGLAMVRSIVNSIGGTIRFSSLFGEGTTFIMTLPRPGEQEVTP